jgi:hypothetical protein
MLPSPYVGSAMGLSNGQVFVPEIWVDDLLRFRDKKLLASDLCRKIMFLGKKNDTLHLPKISRLGVYPRLPETPVTLQALSEGEYTMLIDRDVESSFSIEDILEMQAKYNLRSEYTREAAYALARDIDNQVLAMRAALKFAGQELDTGATIVEADILTAKEALDVADVPAEGRKLLIAPQQESDIMSLNRFISRDYIDGPSVMQRGRIIGSLFGADVIVSTQITKNSLTGYTNGANGIAAPTPGVAGSPYLPTQDSFTGLNITGNRYSALYVHPDWCNLAMALEPRVTASWENLYQMNIIVSRQIYAAKLFRPDHGFVITTVS